MTENTASVFRKGCTVADALRAWFSCRVLSSFRARLSCSHDGRSAIWQDLGYSFRVRGVVACTVIRAAPPGKTRRTGVHGFPATTRHCAARATSRLRPGQNAPGEIDDTLSPVCRSRHWKSERRACAHRCHDSVSFSAGHVTRWPPDHGLLALR